MITTAIIFGLTASMSIAQPRGGGVEKADANGDGVITRAEVQADVKAKFAKMDVDGNGVLDKADREAKKAQHFAKTDTNGDGELSQAEMDAAHQARMAKHAERRGDKADKRAERYEANKAERFAALDTDGSGGISMAEMEAGHEAMKEKRKAKMAENGDKKGRKGGKGKMAAKVMVKWARSIWTVMAMTQLAMPKWKPPH